MTVLHSTLGFLVLRIRLVAITLSYLLPVNEPWMGSYSKPTVSPLCTQESLSPQGISLLRPQFLLLAIFGHGFLAISSKVLLLLWSKVTKFFFKRHEKWEMILSAQDPLLQLPAVLPVTTESRTTPRLHSHFRTSAVLAQEEFWSGIQGAATEHVQLMDSKLVTEAKVCNGYIYLSTKENGSTTHWIPTARTHPGLILGC